MRRFTRRSRTTRGFTLVEVSIGVALTALLTSGAAGMIGTTNGLAAETRSALRAEQECLRNLTAVKNVLRSAAWTTLSGFDAKQAATAVDFQRVVGSGPSGRILGPVERLEWRASSAQVRGIAKPGDVVLISSGAETPLARRVVADGFRVEREGYLLRVRLSTYSVADKLATVAQRESAVSVRN